MCVFVGVCVRACGTAEGRRVCYMNLLAGGDLPCHNKMCFDRSAVSMVSKLSNSLSNPHLSHITLSLKCKQMNIAKILLVMELIENDIKCGGDVLPWYIYFPGSQRESICRNVDIQIQRHAGPVQILQYSIHPSLR